MRTKKENKLDQYRDNLVLGAPPVSLARLLLEEAIQSCRSAIVSMKADQPFERSRHISRAVNLLSEFMLMLNSDAAPELVRSLCQVCEYGQRRLLTAHIQQSEECLMEVISLLNPILEAWAEMLQGGRRIGKHAALVAAEGQAAQSTTASWV